MMAMADEPMPPMASKGVASSVAECMPTAVATTYLLDERVTIDVGGADNAGDHTRQGRRVGDA